MWGGVWGGKIFFCYFGRGVIFLTRIFFWGGVGGGVGGVGGGGGGGGG